MSTGGGSQILPSNQPPSTIEYGGDEISALVLDPGSCWTRAGFAGEDTPKSVIPTHYGAIDSTSDDKPQLFFGDNDVHSLRAGMDIRNPMSDGLVADWDVIPALWRHALTSRLTTDLTEHPLLVTEPAWNTPKNREKTAEIAFEDFGVPAFYLAKSAVCAGFASGKASCLVIDAGASNISITPVHDGFVLKKGCQRAPIGGDFLSAQIRAYLKNINTPLSAHYQVLEKRPVDVAKPADAKYRTFAPGQEPTESYRTFQEERVLTDLKETCIQAWAQAGTFPAPNTPEGTIGVGGRAFEFPDGYNLVFGSERYKIAEGIFNPHQALTGSPEGVLSFKDLIMQSAKDTDVEIRQHILNNVVVTGAGSLLYGFNDRVGMEIATAAPGPRNRLTAPGNSMERRYASWLGGSILASLGSFHQLWVSKKEYEEHGPNIVEKRCK